MELVRDVAFYVFGLAFLSGLLLTAITGSARPVKIYLAVLSVIFVLVSIAGFAFSSGWLIFLYTQLIVLWLIIYMVIITGAVVGAGLYMLLHRQHPGALLADSELRNYLELGEFAAREGITEDRALSRIRSGFYRGGRHGQTWYVHKSELSADPDDGI